MAAMVGDFFSFGLWKPAVSRGEAIMLGNHKLISSIIAVNLLKNVSIWEEAALAHGKTALVTGAAGFIGSHVARLSREEEL